MTTEMIKAMAELNKAAGASGNTRQTEKTNEALRGLDKAAK